MPAATISLTEVDEIGASKAIKDFLNDTLVAELLVILQDFEDRIYALENP